VVSPVCTVIVPLRGETQVFTAAEYGVATPEIELPFRVIQPTFEVAVHAHPDCTVKLPSPPPTGKLCAVGDTEKEQLAPA
jgi:hypothetical protein